jgi:carbamoylphosphate synthase large subunit
MQAAKTILTIGWDSNICLGVAYCLNKAGYKVYLLTHNKNNAGNHSRFISKRFTYNTESDLASAVLEIVKKEKIDLVMPYDEIETRTIKENQGLFEPYTTCSWATAPEQFNIGINKAVLASFLEKHGIPNPPTSLPQDQEKINQIINDFGFPLLIKKTRSSAGRGIQKIYSTSELLAFFNTNDPAHYLI